MFENYATKGHLHGIPRKDLYRKNILCFLSASINFLQSKQLSSFKVTMESTLKSWKNFTIKMIDGSSRLFPHYVI